MYIDKKHLQSYIMLILHGHILNSFNFYLWIQLVLSLKSIDTQLTGKLSVFHVYENKWFHNILSPNLETMHTSTTLQQSSIQRQIRFPILGNNDMLKMLLRGSTFWLFSPLDRVGCAWGWTPDNYKLIQKTLSQSLCSLKFTFNPYHLLEWRSLVDLFRTNCNYALHYTSMISWKLLYQIIYYFLVA